MIVRQVGLPLLCVALAMPVAGQEAGGGDRERLLTAAASELAAGRRTEAARLLRTAADRFESVQALLQLARLQSEDGDAAAGLATLQRARQLAPNAEEVLAASAQLALAAGRPVQAIDTLDPLTRICPTVAPYHYLLGIAYLQAGGMEQASDALRRADEIEPGQLTTLTALGLALNGRKRHAEAEAVLAHALALEPTHADVLAALAEAEEALGHEARAEEHAARALAANPAHATANFVLGVIRMKQERYADARDALLTAIASQPALAKAHYQVSLAYARLGDESSSQEHMRLYRQTSAEMEAALKKLRTERGLPELERR